jgi:hypothetical protein
MTDEMLHPARRNAVEAQVANVYVREGPHRGDPAPRRLFREALSRGSVDVVIAPGNSLTNVEM